MSTVEFLQGQLERLFELDGMMALSSELLGVEPAQVGGTSAKGTFARALVRHCASNDDLTTLAEAIRLSASEKHESMEQLANGDEELRDRRLIRSFAAAARRRPTTASPSAAATLRPRACRSGLRPTS